MARDLDDIIGGQGKCAAPDPFTERIAGQQRFAEVVTRLTALLVQNFAMEGPFECEASAEYTVGIKHVNTPYGPVRVVSVLGGDRTVRVREISAVS